MNPSRWNLLEKICWVVIVIYWIAAMGIIFGGCSGGVYASGSMRIPGDRAPAVAMTTSSSRTVMVERWAGPSNLTTRILNAFELTEPLPDPRIPPGARGLPPGWIGHAMPPGYHDAPQSPTGLAIGETDLTNRIVYVHVRPCVCCFDEFLPALAWELRIAWTEDIQGQGWKDPVAQ